MGFEKINGEEWFREELYTDVAQSVKVKSKLVEDQSTLDGKKLQDIVIIDTERYGKVLILDGIFQTTEKDEIFYHEPLVHFPMFSHPNPKKVLIIGGGDGGIMREVLKHNIEHVDLVDIDGKVIEYIKKFMPTLPETAFEDPRAHVHVEDGFKFVARCVNENIKYDVVIVDSPDPVGPAVSLFSREFYLDIKRILADNGIVVRQTGSIVLQSDEMPSNFRHMKEIFSDVTVFTTDVPTYQGGIFSFVAGSNKVGIFNKDLEELKKRYAESGIKTKYYSPENHLASMKLPKFAQDNLTQYSYGEELIIDMAGCNQDTIKSEKKWREFVVKLCDDVLKMKRYGETIVEDFGFAKSRTAGFSIVQLIETSSIVAHVANYWGYVCLDIFTCAPFDPKATIKFTKEFFEAEKIKALYVKRGEFLTEEIQMINLPKN